MLSTLTRSLFTSPSLDEGGRRTEGGGEEGGGEGGGGEGGGIGGGGGGGGEGGGGGGDGGRGGEEEGEDMYHNLHLGLQTVLALVPRASSQLVPALSKQYPYLTRGVDIQVRCGSCTLTIYIYTSYCRIIWRE